MTFLPRAVPACLAAWLCSIAPAAQAASFDCARASTAVEQAICRSDAVSALDDEVDRLYRARMADAASGGERQAWLESQRAWLKGVRNACADELCLLAAYKARSLSLSAAPQPSPAAEEAGASSPSPEATAENGAAAASPASSPEPAARVADVAAAVSAAAASQPPKAASGAQAATAGAAPSDAHEQDAPWFVKATAWLVMAILFAFLLGIVLRLWQSLKNLASGRGAADRPGAAPRAWHERFAAWTSLPAHAIAAMVMIPGLLLVHWTLALAYAIVYFAWGRSSRCPACHRMYARVEGHSKVIDVDSGYETVTRHDEVRAYNGNVLDALQGGERVGTIVRREQVHVTYTTRRHYYSCKHCDHLWSEKRTTSD